METIGDYEIDRVYQGDAAELLIGLPDNSIPLTVTSPEYDNMREYGGNGRFRFHQIADQLYRVTKPGGVVVWVVGDQVIDGSETGSSYRQALYFMGSAIGPEADPMTAAFLDVCLALPDKRLDVCLGSAPKRRFTGHMIRVVNERNPQWYRDLCADYPSSRRIRRCKFDTVIRRQGVIRALQEISDGRCQSTYARRVMPYVRQRASNPHIWWAEAFS